MKQSTKDKVAKRMEFVALAILGIILGLAIQHWAAPGLLYGIS